MPAPKPGHPVDERLAAGWRPADARSKAEVLREINAFVDRMRANAEASAALLADLREKDDGGKEGADGA